MLKLSDVTLRRGGRVLFAAATVAVFPGQKVGLTGANGTGKSSLFALLRGELHADAIAWREHHGRAAEGLPLAVRRADLFERQ